MNNKRQIKEKLGHGVLINVFVTNLNLRRSVPVI